MRKRKSIDIERNKRGQFDRFKSLQDLDGEDWGSPDKNDSHLVQECLRLRRVALKDFTVENLRIMIGQYIGLQHLIPLALEKLRVDPLAEGNCYGGDLLQNVLSVPSSFWVQNPDWAKEIAEISEHALALCASSPAAAERTIPEQIQQAFVQFDRDRRTPS